MLLGFHGRHERILARYTTYKPYSFLVSCVTFNPIDSFAQMLNFSCLSTWNTLGNNRSQICR